MMIIHRVRVRRQYAWMPLCFLLGFVLPCHAQQQVRVTVVNNAVLVPVEVNDHALTFLIDTGSEQSAIDTNVAKNVGLKVGGREEVMKDYREQETDVLKSSRLRIGEIGLDHEKLVVVSLKPLGQALGHEIDGVLGNDVLQRFPFTLSYSSQILIVNPAKAEQWGSPIDLRRSGDEYFLPLKILSQPSELLLDSGTNSTNLSWSTWQKLSQEWKPPRVVDGIARAGSPTPSSFLVCLPSISLGGLEVNQQAVRVQRMVESGTFASPGFAGILGSDVLKKFEVTFDLSHNRMYVKKDTHYKSDPYRFVTVGLQFARSEGGYAVMSVWRDSPAERAGILPGDLITAVNGRAALALTPQEFSDHLHGRSGTAVELVVVRDNDRRKVTLHTRALLCEERGG